MPEMPRTTTWHLPAPDAETAPYWKATAEGRLLIKFCNGCSTSFFYPRAACPRCWSSDTEWREASGRGTVYTYTIVYQNDLPPFRDRVPYVVAEIDLEEGVRMTSNVENVDPASVRCGMPVVVAFREEPRSESESLAIPVFHPASA